jgi:hypothetical protein
MLTAAPSVLYFGGQVIGTNTPLDVTLSNNTSKPLAVVKLFASSADYSYLNHCTAPLAPGKSCAVTATFHPTLIGREIAGLVIFSSDGNSADGFGRVIEPLAGYGLKAP